MSARALLGLILATGLLPGAISTQAADHRGLRRALEASAAQDNVSSIIGRPEAQAKVLIICNAYAFSRVMRVYNMRTAEQLTASQPLAYKECGEFHVSLREGDQLDFKAGEYSVGIFRASGLPKASASLLLVPHRKGASSMSTAFESHVFRDLQNSQIVLVDAYSGKDRSRVKIMDTKSSAGKMEVQATRTENLAFNSVAALNPGMYTLMLQDSAGKSISSAALQVEAKKGAKHVVMRVGISDDSGKVPANATAYPQELVIYSQGVQQAQGSGALRLPGLTASIALLLALLLGM